MMTVDMQSGCRVAANPPRLGRGKRECKSLHPDHHDAGKASALGYLTIRRRVAVSRRRRVSA